MERLETARAEFDAAKEKMTAAAKLAIDGDAKAAALAARALAELNRARANLQAAVRAGVFHK